MSSNAILVAYDPPLSSLGILNGNFFNMLDMITGNCVHTGEFNLYICSKKVPSLVTDFIDQFTAEVVFQ